MTIPVRVSDRDLLNLFGLDTARRATWFGQEVYSTRQWRDTGMYREYLRPSGFEQHMENIYGRLQVSSRTAAVTRAFGTVR